MFTSHGSYISPQAYVNGLVPAVWVGAAVLAAGALIAAALPFSTRASAARARSGRGRGVGPALSGWPTRPPERPVGSRDEMATDLEPHRSSKLPVSASRPPSAGTR